MTVGWKMAIAAGVRYGSSHFSISFMACLSPEFPHQVEAITANFENRAAKFEDVE
jgi:hypothetical protein